MLASELFALTQTNKCAGDLECHWCGGPCGRLLTHDDVQIRIPFVKNASTAKRPDNPYVCTGCWLFAKKRSTVNFLDGSYQDGQALAKHSWWIASGSTIAVKPLDGKLIYDKLLSPPLLFSMCLLNQGGANRLHEATVNEFVEIKAETELHFTMNNLVMSYTVYELRYALESGDATGTEPGVQTLVGFFGPCKLEVKEKKQGRPSTEVGKKTLEPKDKVVASGSTPA